MHNRILRNSGTFMNLISVVGLQFNTGIYNPVRVDGKWLRNQFTWSMASAHSSPPESVSSSMFWMRRLNSYINGSLAPSLFNACGGIYCNRIYSSLWRNLITSEQFSTGPSILMFWSLFPVNPSERSLYSGKTSNNYAFDSENITSYFSVYSSINLI